MIGDTIAAAATPIGESAIGVLRISGPRTIPMIKQIFLPAVKKTALSIRGQFLGRIQDPKTGNFLDEVLVSVFPFPHSYTGEDCAEISCHGNPFIIKEVLALIFSLGARLAEPGEFTQRAYLNGKMDLTQAEAVNDLIRSHTLLSAEAALSQLGGRFAA
jgi:tRNA modification GTPase